jgi:PAS domain S-box-containing protein
MDQYLAEIINAANEGIYVTDIDRTFLIWNDAAEKISGYSKPEILGRHCHDNILSHSDSDGHALCFLRCPLQAAMEDGKPHGPEVVQLRHKSGKRISVEVRTAPIRDKAGAIVGGVEVFQDVTERLESERLLAERQEKLETVLNNIGDGILFFDSGGAISVINRACALMFEIESDVRGSAVDALPERSPLRQALSMSEESYRRAASGRPAAGVCSESGGAFRCWTRVSSRSSCYACPAYHSVRTFLERPQELTRGDRTFAVISSFIESPDRDALSELVVFHDVTAAKLDAALKVAGAAAHELRQPLQVMMAAAGFVEEKLKGDSKQKENLGLMIDSCDRMNDIIKMMCDLTAYRTMDYVDGVRILDIARSSRGTGAPSRSGKGSRAPRGKKV